MWSCRSVSNAKKREKNKRKKSLKAEADKLERGCMRGPDLNKQRNPLLSCTAQLQGVMHK